MLVAILYLLCGVGPEVIANEYALTDKGLENLKPIFVDRLLKNPALAGNEEGVRNMTSSRAENMRRSLDMVGRDFGGAEKYVRDVVGLGEEEIRALKRNLVSGETAVL